MPASERERTQALWRAAAWALVRRLPRDLVLTVLGKIDAWPWHVPVSSEPLHLSGPTPRHWRRGTAALGIPLLQQTSAAAFAFSNLESHGASAVVLRIGLPDANMAFETRVPRFDRAQVLPQGYFWFFGPCVGGDQDAPRVAVYCVMLSHALVRLTVESVRPHSRSLRTYDRCLSPRDLQSAAASLGELTVLLFNAPQTTQPA